MTTKECKSRDRRLVEKIRAVFQVNRMLGQYATAVHITIENASVVIRGELPSRDHKAQLVPAVRQAGVLNRVSDHVRIAS